MNIIENLPCHVRTQPPTLPSSDFTLWDDATQSFLNPKMGMTLYLSAQKERKRKYQGNTE